MKTLIMTMLALAAVGANVAFAAENDGIVSAAPAIADPVNPQPGLLANAYKIITGSPHVWSWNKYMSMTTLSALEKAPSVKTYADKRDSFMIADGLPKDTVNTIKWEGFIKCIRATSYTFSFNGNVYSFYVNGRQHVVNGEGRTYRDIDLKIGWNKVVIVAYVKDNGNSNQLFIKYRPKGSMSDPRPLSPGMMFYDKPVEEVW